MKKSAGSVNFVESDHENGIKWAQAVPEYGVGNMSHMVYPVGGGMEDWGYGASWDNKDPKATVERCFPYTYDLTGKLYHMSFDQQSKVRSLIYLVETHMTKQPPAWTLGGRYSSETKTVGIFD